MERKLSNKVGAVHDGFITAEQIIKEFSTITYLNSVLLDLNKNLSISNIKFLFYEKLSNKKGYKSYVIEINNTKLMASCTSEGFFPQNQIDELSQSDPTSYPPGILDVEKVKIDLDQLVKIALNEPPYFTFAELENLSNIDASLFVRDNQILWRFLCEYGSVGFRTLHIDAESGSIVLNRLDKINK